MIKIYYLTTTEQDNNVPIYVGITKRSLKRRLGGHISDAKKGNSKIHNWIKNRILENSTITINLIDEVELKDAYFWEDFYIDLFKTWGFPLKNMLYSGYSINNVNNKGVMSKEARSKLSNLYSGKTRDRSLVEKSIKNRLEEANKRGYYHSVETKLKISKIHKNKFISDEERIRLKEIRKLVTPRMVPVLALDLKYNITKYYESVTKAAKELKCYTSNIAKVVSGKRNQTGGYYFCYVGSNCPIKIG